jgi:LPXTG-motif cell wall-anchored protein
VKKLIAGTVLTLGTALGLASSAHAGTLTYYRECAPNGDTIVYLTAIDGGTTIYIDGIQTHMLVTGPGVHTAEFYGPATNGDGTTDPTRIVLWGSTTITVEPSNCPQPSTTTATTQAPPTDSEATTSTAPPAPVPTTAPPANETVCLDDPTLCDPPADVTGTTLPALPATGQDNTALLAAAGALLAIGSTLVLVRRRPS